MKRGYDDETTRGFLIILGLKEPRTRRKEIMTASPRLKMRKGLSETFGKSKLINGDERICLFPSFQKEAQCYLKTL